MCYVHYRKLFKLPPGILVKRMWQVATLSKSGASLKSTADWFMRRLTKKLQRLEAMAHDQM